MKKTLLEVKNLFVSFDHNQVLSDVSFSVDAQEVLAIVGPNGSGKSVLLKTLMGLIKQDKGEVSWLENIRIGYLPQRFYVDSYLPMTVSEFLNLKPKYSSKRWFDADKQFSTKEVFELLKLDNSWLHKNMAHLSGGELQKVLLAWAIMDKPQILLFDEPTENVDIVSQDSIYNLLHHLQETLKISIIIVSHDLHVVYRYATRVLCLNKKMVCYGEPQKTLTADRLSELYSDHAFFHHKHYK